MTSDSPKPDKHINLGPMLTRAEFNRLLLYSLLGIAAYEFPKVVFDSIPGVSSMEFEQYHTRDSKTSKSHELSQRMNILIMTIR